MKKRLLPALGIIALLLLFAHSRSTSGNQVVNAVIGDISYKKQFGCAPNDETNNQLRIVTHLAYVEQELRKKDASSLTPTLQQQRRQMLDHLHTYRLQGQFPKNFDYPGERKPCFIDREGSICAVGYLIEQTEGRSVAEAINRKHQYEYLLDMEDEGIDQWVASSGLTREECAMIQPTYGGVTPLNPSTPISAGYAISTSVLGGVNLSLNTLNGIQIGRGANNKAVPVLGLIGGAAQIALGAINFPPKEVAPGVTAPNEGTKALSMVNIGLGTTTFILSAWNLITNRKPREKVTTWNIRSFRTPGNGNGLALALTRKL